MRYAVHYETMVTDVGPIVPRMIYFEFTNPPSTDDIYVAMAGVEGRYYITSCEADPEDAMLYAYEF